VSLLLPMSLETAWAILLALFPFGWEMLNLPHEKIVGGVCWVVCAVILADVANKKWRLAEEIYFSAKTVVPMLELVAALSSFCFVMWHLLPKGFNKTTPEPSTQVAIPVFREWGGSTSYCTGTLNGDALSRYSDKYEVAIACGFSVSSVDRFKDTGIAVSQPFAIRPGNIPIRMNVTAVAPLY